jgi:hypothetical protein
VATPANTVRRARSAGEDVAHSSAFEVLARAGFVARGLVYGIIGILALKLALGDAGKTASQTGALKTIAHQPFGHVLLVLVAIGLGGYALWRLVRAALGHGPEDSDGAFDRVAALGSGLAYAALCATAVSILAGSSSSESPKTATGGILGWPAGPWLVGIAGAVLAGIALYQGWRGVSRDFLHDSKTEQMSEPVRRAITALGVVGHLARMVVFALVGIFLIKAAADYNAQKAVGLDGALGKLAHASYGPILLGVVAVGLIAFALYSLSDARYRRI